jgi:hypothetical protein
VKLSSGVLVALHLLAVYRLTRLVVADSISEPTRKRVWRRFGTASWLGKLVNCEWCASIWIAAPMTYWLFHSPTTYSPAAAFLAASAAAGLLSGHEGN